MMHLDKWYVVMLREKKKKKKKETWKDFKWYTALSKPVFLTINQLYIIHLNEAASDVQIHNELLLLGNH